MTLGAGVGLGRIAADALILRQLLRSKSPKKRWADDQRFPPVVLGGSNSGSLAMDVGKDGRADPAYANPADEVSDVVKERHR
jgi:hypothetical protein